MAIFARARSFMASTGNPNQWINGYPSEELIYQDIVHEDANDLLQNTLIKIWNNLPTFRGDSKLYTWLYRIATNEALTWLKKQRFESRFARLGFDKSLCNKLTTDDFFNGDQIQLALQKEVMQLPDKQRAIFSMILGPAFLKASLNALRAASLNDNSFESTGCIFPS